MKTPLLLSALRRVLLGLAVMMASGCRTETALGRYVGAFQQQRMDPRYDYEVSARNVVLAIVFGELVIPQVLVVLKYTHCPVATKAQAVTP